MRRMKGGVHRDVWILSLGFGFLFFGTGAAQQYVSLLLTSRGLAPYAGTNVLLILYGFYLSGCLITHHAVRTWGERICLLGAASMYAVFILSIAHAPLWACYMAAAGCGVAAAILWTAQLLLLNRLKEGSSAERSAGVFHTLYSLGNGVGTLTAGIVTSRYGLSIAFWAMVIAAVCAVGIFSFLSSVDGNRAEQVQKQGSESAAFPWRRFVAFAAFSLSARMVYGLVIARLPMDIGKQLGAGAVGVVTSLVFLIPIFFPSVAAELTLRWGRFASAILGCALSVGGVVVLYWASDYPRFIAGTICAALGQSILYPLTTVFPQLFPAAHRRQIAVWLAFANACGIVFTLILARSVSSSSIYLAVAGIMSLLSGSCLRHLWSQPEQPRT